MIDILVISHSCFRRVNRLVFNRLSSDRNLKLHIIAPKILIRNGFEKKADSMKHDDVEMTLDTLIGNNPRTYRFKNTFKLLNYFKPKMIYLDNDPVSFQAINIGYWASKNNSKVVCLSCENLSFDFWVSYNRLGFKGIFSSVFKKIVLSISKKNIDHVFTINNDGYDMFKKLKFKSVSKSPLGFDPKIFSPNTTSREKKRRELRIKDYEIVIAYVGRSVFEKGIHVLLSSLSKIKENKKWTLILDQFSSTKTAYQKKILEQIKYLNLSDRVKFFDASHEDIAKYINASDIMVVPSVSTPNWVEQYGRVAPEAMACGKLVVSSDVGALPEIINDCGLIFKEANSDQLAEILTKCVNSYSKFNEIRKKALHRAVKFYSINSQAKVIFDKYKELTNLI